MLEKNDPEIFDAIEKEKDRQLNGIELIASENYVSEDVLEATGSILTNKYAEGYPGHRYYGGCEYIDVIENIARERVLKLFGAEHANVQPHSGSQANMGVYMSVLSPGDTILGMDLSSGGHLTHGGAMNFSGKIYKSISYGLHKDTELLDYEDIERLATGNKPKMIVAGASAYPRKIDFAKFKRIADMVGAYLMVDMAHIAGLVATGVHESPVPYADFVTSTAHKTLRGPRSGFILCKEKYAAAVDKTIFPGIQGGPLEHVIAAKAVAFAEALKPGFKSYIERVVKNTKVLGEVLMEEGFELVSGGTDNHLILVKLVKQEITGQQAEDELGKVHITVNKNGIPNDPQPKTVTSGIRIGGAAVTTRGFDESDMREIGHIIAKVLQNVGNDKIYDESRKKVQNICSKYPVPGIKEKMLAR